MTPESPGKIAERQTQLIAAQLGVADFVYTQPVVHERSSNDEVGDGLLIVGDRGAVLEVKSREPSVGLRDSPIKAERSVRKFIEAAAKQGSGSKRTIQKYQALGRPLQAIPARAFEFSEEIRETFALELSADCAKWPTIVIVDHPQEPRFAITPPAGVFCISLTDWRELLRRVRSVTGVLLYVERVLGSTLTTVFGAEHLRFAKVCEADRLSARSPISHPWFSLAAVEDPLGVELYRDMIAKVWHGQLRGPYPALTPEEVRIIMAFLDDAPISRQAQIGRWTFRKRDEIQGPARTASGSSVFDDRLFVYMCSSADAWEDYNAWVAELGALTMVRLLHWRESRGGSTSALGIGVREVDDGVEYTYIYSSEPVSVPADVRANIEWKYGVANLTYGHSRVMTPGRNDFCPCGSGTKFKRCHGAPGQREVRQEVATEPQ